MTTTEFRNLALSLPETVESSHMDHPDFRVAGKIFATLGHPDKTCGMVKLNPKQQAEFVESNPEIFQPVKGGWGDRGATTVRLAGATEGAVRAALAMAWRNTAPRRLARRFRSE